MINPKAALYELCAAPPFLIPHSSFFIVLHTPIVSSLDTSSLPCYHTSNFTESDEKKSTFFEPAKRAAYGKSSAERRTEDGL
jgi:hypothetical protein